MVCFLLLAVIGHYSCVLATKGQDGVLIRTFILVTERVLSKNFVMTCFKYLFAT